MTPAAAGTASCFLVLRGSAALPFVGAESPSFAVLCLLSRFAAPFAAFCLLLNRMTLLVGFT